MSDQSRKSIDNVLFEARTVVNDGVEPFRNPDTTLLQYLNTALRVIYSIRPDAYIGEQTQGVTSTVLPSTFTEADLGATPPAPFPLDDRLFFYPVVAYIAGRIEMADDEFTDAARSQQLMQAFVNQLQGL